MCNAVKNRENGNLNHRMKNKYLTVGSQSIYDNITHMCAENLYSNFELTNFFIENYYMFVIKNTVFFPSIS